MEVGQRLASPEGKIRPRRRKGLDNGFSQRPAYVPFGYSLPTPGCVAQYFLRILRRLKECAFEVARAPPRRNEAACSGDYLRSAFGQNLMRMPVENRKLFCEPPPNRVIR